MKEMYNNYKKELTKKNNLLLLVFIIFIIGIIFGSIYITILSNTQKENIMTSVVNYYKETKNITFDDKLEIFKNSFLSNIIYMCFIWLLGISVIGLPIIFIMVFFKSFVLGFSVSSIFAKYGFKGILKAIIYIFPSKLIYITYILFLATYSIIISCKIFFSAFKKENINFKTFMGKYFFLLIIGILISIFCSLYDAFLDPLFIKYIN